MKVSLKGGAASFAHLFGRPTLSSKAKKAEEEEDRDERAEGEEPEDEDKETAEGEKPSDGEDEKGKKAKKSKRCEDDDGEEEAEAEDDEPDNDDAEARGAKAERSRWVKTLSSKHAAGKGAAALHMLATTDMTSRQIVGVLSELPASDAKAGRVSLDERMANRRQINPGTGGSQQPAEGPAATAQAMCAVYDRFVGRK